MHLVRQLAEATSQPLAPSILADKSDASRIGFEAADAPNTLGVIFTVEPLFTTREAWIREVEQFLGEPNVEVTLKGGRPGRMHDSDARASRRSR